MEMKMNKDIKYCPHCKSKIFKTEHPDYNAFSCSNCGIKWNIQYLSYA